MTEPERSDVPRTKAGQELSTPRRHLGGGPLGPDGSCTHRRDPRMPCICGLTDLIVAVEAQAVAAWLDSEEAERALARAYATVHFGEPVVVTGAERKTAADILEEMRRSNSEAG